MSQEELMHLADTFEASRSILKSSDHKPMSMADEYRRVGNRLGLDFSPTIMLLDRMPVFMEGQTHRDVRAMMARFLGATRIAQEDAIKKAIAGSAPTFQRPGSIEVRQALVNPLWRAFSEAMLGQNTSMLDLALQVPRLFNRNLRLQERIIINDAIRDALELAADAEEFLMMLGVTALGVAPLTGSMLLSLHHAFSNSIGKPLSTVLWGTVFAVSALEVTDRVPIAGDGAIRCVLHSPKFSDDENKELLFGAGNHLCLGKAAALHMWQAVTSMLAASPLCIRDVALDLRHSPPEAKDDFTEIQEPFLYPHSLTLALSE